MTLNKKLSCWMMGGLLLIFLSVAITTFCIQRQYYRLQLDCSARNIEVSLGVMLAKPLSESNVQLIESMMNQIFDQGVLYLLQVRGSHNELVVSQNKAAPRHYAPDWFVALIRWPTLLQSIPIMYDQKPVGRLLVSADPTGSYEALWGTFLVLFYCYFFWLIVSLISIYCLTGWLGTPLSRMTQQVIALGRRQFLMETKLPSTEEFKKLALAMNHSVTELKNNFKNQVQHMELLRRQLFQDKLTGFGNSQYFTYQLSGLLYRDEKFIPGFIVGVAIEQLAEFKEQCGELRSLELIKETANLCFNFWRHYPDLVIAQIEPGRFALIIKENDEQLLIKQCDEFSQKIQQFMSKRTGCPVLLAVVSYQDYHEKSLLMSELDQTLLKAKNESYNLALSSHLSSHRQVSMSVQELKTVLDHQLEYLSAHPISNGHVILHHEISPKVSMNEELIQSSYFMPMARREGLAQQLDFFVLSEICEKKLVGMQAIAFTLSDTILSNEHLLEHCLLQLKALTPEYLRCLRFEVDECFVFEHIARLIDFYKELHHLGMKLGVKNAGIHFSTMNYLNELPLHYLKLHSSLSHDIDDDKEFIIYYFHELAEILGLQIIASGVQSEKEWQVLQDKGVRWGQGDYFNS